MSRLRAPTDMRMPISRVRSVTDTSMMFMMPMPPTRSDTPAIAARSVVRVFEVSDAVSMISAWFMTLKSSSSPVSAGGPRGGSAHLGLGRLHQVFPDRAHLDRADAVALHPA